jgi:hypothetical protein
VTDFADLAKTANQGLAEKLTQLWTLPAHQREFPVNAPVKLTESVAAGGFHKKSFIGEETMMPFGAYVGKRGGMILKFREEGFGSAHIEMTVSEAQNHLEGFTTYYFALIDNMEDLLTAEHREMAQAKEEAADMEARRASDPIFGSWS